MGKVIFLDVDGVLNNDLTQDTSPGGWIGVDDELIAHLARIVTETGAEVVLTSTWKDEWDVEPRLCTSDGRYLAGHLAMHGVFLKDKTYDLTHNRGEGIAQYLREHPEVERYVVIDDVVFPDFGRNGILPHLIKTNNPLGLTKRLAYRAIKMLNEEADTDETQQEAKDA